MLHFICIVIKDIFTIKLWIRNPKACLKLIGKEVIVSFRYCTFNTWRIILIHLSTICSSRTTDTSTSCNKSSQFERSPNIWVTKRYTHACKIRQRKFMDAVIHTRGLRSMTNYCKFITRDLFSL